MCVCKCVFISEVKECENNVCVYPKLWKVKIRKKRVVSLSVSMFKCIQVKVTYVLRSEIRGLNAWEKKCVGYVNQQV